MPLDHVLKHYCFVKILFWSANFLALLVWRWNLNSEPFWNWEDIFVSFLDNIHCIHCIVSNMYTQLQIYLLGPCLTGFQLILWIFFSCSEVYLLNFAIQVFLFALWSLFLCDSAYAMGQIHGGCVTVFVMLEFGSGGLLFNSWIFLLMQTFGRS